MKKLLPVLILFVGVIGVFAQGTVDFNNNRTFATTADRLVRFSTGQPVVGTNYMAQLYYGADAGNLRAVTTAPARFRVPTTTQPGTWSGGTRTLEGFTAGSTVTLVVYVWDSNPDGTITRWEDAAIRTSSDLFTYTVPVAGSPASAFYLENLRGLYPLPVIPEPSVFALGFVGACALFILRRRKILQARTPKDRV